MKRYFLALLLVVMSTNCWGAGHAPSRPESGSLRSEGKLQPDFSRSFATITETSTDVCLLGDGWALQASLPSPESVLECGSYAVNGTLTRGPNLDQFIRPSAGPPTLPLPTDGRYSTVPVKGLVVAVHDTVRAYGGSLILQFSGFEAGGSRFPAFGPFKLDIKGAPP